MKGLSIETKAKTVFNQNYNRHYSFLTENNSSSIHCCAVMLFLSLSVLEIFD